MLKTGEMSCFTLNIFGKIEKKHEYRGFEYVCLCHYSTQTTIPIDLIWSMKLTRHLIMI